VEGCAEDLRVRVRQRPEQAQTELTETIDARAITPEQRQATIARMVEKHPGLAALIPRAAGVDPGP
jgi:hypothetical protein